MTVDAADRPRHAMHSRFTLLLISLLVLLLVLPIVATTPYGLVSQAFLAWCAIAAGVWAVDAGRTRSIALLLAILTLCGDAFIWTSQDTPLLPLARVLAAVFLAFVTCVILEHLMTREEVTFDVVIGGVCTYMLIGAFFAQVYAAFEIVAPGSLLEKGHPLRALGANDLARGHIVEVFYYSFVTLTTLGFGDIRLRVPGSHAPRRTAAGPPTRSRLPGGARARAHSSAACRPWPRCR
jgi:hypothetical protein